MRLRLAPLPNHAGQPGKANQHHCDCQPSHHRVSFGPAAQSAANADWPGLDGPPIKESPQVVSHTLRRLVAIARYLPQTLQTNRLKIAGEARLQTTWRHRF